MKNILITGLRAPGSLEWIRSLHKEYNIYGMDFINFPVGRFSKYLKKYIRANIFEGYILELKNIVETYKIDFIIPTCEEIFHLKKQIENENINVEILCDNKIYDLHSKYKFSQMGDNIFKTPKTKLLSKNEIKNLGLEDISNYVFKPEYTRFGTEVFIKPSKHDFANNYDYLLKQEFIDGQEICVYLLCLKGKIIDYSFYYPENRVGKASTYFRWLNDLQLLKIVEYFVNKNHLNGQISFDVIKSNDDYFFIECNPRMTSGIHKISSRLLNYFNLVVKKEKTDFSIGKQKDKMIGLMNVFNKNFWKANDVIFDIRDMKPFIFQWFSTIEFMFLWLKNDKKLIDVSVDDIYFPRK